MRELTTTFRSRSTRLVSSRESRRSCGAPATDRMRHWDDLIRKWQRWSPANSQVSSGRLPGRWRPRRGDRRRAGMTWSFLDRFGGTMARWRILDIRSGRQLRLRCPWLEWRSSATHRSVAVSNPRISAASTVAKTSCRRTDRRMTTDRRKNDHSRWWGRNGFANLTKWQPYQRKGL